MPHSHLPHPRAHRPAPWHRLCLDTAGGVLLATGLVWLGLHYTMGAGAGALPHPLEAWCLRLHGLAAQVGLFALGTVAAVHVPQAWRASARPRWARQRQTGLLLCALAVLLVMSGYLLYYFAPEWLRPGLGWSHAGIGAGMAVCIALHRLGGRRIEAPLVPRSTAHQRK